MVTEILYPRPEHIGWSTVTGMVDLLARCLDAPVTTVSGEQRLSPRRHRLRRLPRRRGRGDLLVVAARPSHLDAVLRPAHWLRGHARVSAWVIDSFETDDIPDVARALGHFDHLFIGDGELVDLWRTVTRTPVTWLPFGTDALAADAPGERAVDLQRIGRMPARWDDDGATSSAAAEHGLSYAGRPPFGHDHADNNRVVRAAMAKARFTLSFSNVAAPAGYTHPTHEYLTARWLDALAHGATVAGVTPACHSSARLLWPEATLELTGEDRDDDLRTIATATREWSPDIATLHHLRSLERTDWRWRFAELADTLQIAPAPLHRELAALRQRIGELSPPPRRAAPSAPPEPTH